MKEELKSLVQAIMADPENQKYTERAIRPLFTVDPQAKILIVGQAPGLKAEQTQKMWNDASGKKLRHWMGITPAEFYCPAKIAILPLDFYYPGRGKSGDLPPRKEFAAKWHPQLWKYLPQVKLTLLVGSYAQHFYLRQPNSTRLTTTVREYRKYLPRYFPLVHPSPLNYGWLKKNPWFENEVVSELQYRVKSVLN
ncbi:uracil dna glycosylase superfamily protein [Liquorilactobacillus nagelii DSM 13675]|nr:uracil dna glycosylase superfamily protein [Liquorilactobacillus nagelii DSM 13675]